jgi:hypothetical protein
MASSRLKTIDAVTKHVVLSEMKSIALMKRHDKQIRKEMRSRSLNFHSFGTLPPVNLEVSVYISRKNEDVRKLRNLNYKELVQFLSVYSSECMDSGKLILDAVEGFLDRIPVNMYPKLLEIISHEPHSSQVGSRLLLQLITVLARKQRIGSQSSGELYKIGDLTMKRSDTLPLSTFTRMRKLISIEFHEYMVNSEERGHEVDHALQYLSSITCDPIKNERILMREARLRLERSLEESLCKLPSSPVFVLMKGEDLISADPNSLLRSLTIFLSVTSRFGMCQSLGFFRFRRLVNEYIYGRSNQLERSDLLNFFVEYGRSGLQLLPCGSGVFSEYLRGIKRLSSLSEKEMKLLVQSMNSVGYHNRFGVLRVEGACKALGIQPIQSSITLKDVLEKFSQSKLLNHEQRGRLILSIPQYLKKHRTIRVLIAKVIRGLNPGRLEAETVRDILTELNLNDDIKQGFSIALAFHYP